jgi:hypothetical protein
MQTSACTAEPLTYPRRQVEPGTPVAEVGRQLGSREQTVDRGKRAPPLQPGEGRTIRRDLTRLWATRGQLATKLAGCTRRSLKPPVTNLTDGPNVGCGPDERTLTYHVALLSGSRSR